MIKAFRQLSLFSTLNAKEMKQFDAISNWWHPAGPMQMLHLYNYHRVHFLLQHIPTTMPPVLPLNSLRVLDVGCGAGILAKSLARLGATVVGLDPNKTSFREATLHKQKYQAELSSLKYYN